MTQSENTAPDRWTWLVANAPPVPEWFIHVPDKELPELGHAHTRDELVSLLTPDQALELVELEHSMMDKVEPKQYNYARAQAHVNIYNKYIRAPYMKAVSDLRVARQAAWAVSYANAVINGGGQRENT